MDTKQKQELKLSEARVKLGELLEVPQETRGESFADDLAMRSREVKAAEIELQAAILASPDEPVETRKEHGPEETAEDRELLELRSRVHFGRYVGAAMAGGGVLAGAEAELNDHLGLAANQFPLDLLTRSDVPDDLETRAKRDGDAMASQRTWVDRVFADSAAMRLGITFASVPPGVTAYPVTTAGGGGKQRGREEAESESTYTVAVTELKPTRNAVHGIYSIEDNARLPGLADAILRDMRVGIVEAVDRSIFKGDDGANEGTADITGLQTHASVSEVTLTQANKIKADKTLEAFLGFVDGVYATSMADLMIVAAQGANTLWYSTIHNSAADNETIARFLMAAGLSWTVRGHIESATTNGKFGAFVGLARGMTGAGVAPVWNRGSWFETPIAQPTRAKSS